MPSHGLTSFGAGNGAGNPASNVTVGGGAGSGGSTSSHDPLCSPTSLFVSAAADSGRWGVASGNVHSFFFYSRHVIKHSVI